MLHHVTPVAPRAFEPNGILKVTPGFLETVITVVKTAGFDCIGLDDVPERLTKDSRRKPFAVFTLDDGYKDNRDYAYPIFKRHGVPFTIYVPSSFADGTGDLWWLNLEEAIRQASALTLEMNSKSRTFALSSAQEKTEAFDQIYWWLRELPEDRARAIVRRLAREAGVDVSGVCVRLVMNWDEIRALAADPLITIGAHTTHHLALANLAPARMRREIAESVARVTAELGRPCRHFSYPYGCEMSAGSREFDAAAELGLATAVTTRKGLIHERHETALTALPRLSLNGDFQDRRYVKVLLSGAPFAFWNVLRRFKSGPRGLGHELNAGA
ncbi:polysaccharide deacetylase family protein [Bradyrhizobium sp.]|uniref:polysaccharide deacetylase family protein n=1 Tax=Bradyrhizobium sp. TaxID=376 RepID=UPI003C75333A